MVMDSFDWFRSLRRALKKINKKTKFKSCSHDKVFVFLSLFIGIKLVTVVCFYIFLAWQLHHFPGVFKYSKMHSLIFRELHF